MAAGAVLERSLSSFTSTSGGNDPVAPSRGGNERTENAMIPRCLMVPVAVTLSLSLACGGGDGDDPAAAGGSGGEAGAGGAPGGAGGTGAAAAAGAAGTAVVQGTVQELSPTGTGTVAAAGVEVCVLDDTSSCSTTDAAGQFRVETVPFEARSGVTLTREGMTGTLIPMFVPREQPVVIANTRVTSESTSGLVMSMAGLAWPVEGAGTIVVIVREYSAGEPTLAGALVEAVDASPEGVVYFDDASQPDPTLGVTSASGIALVGSVAAGTVRVRVTHPDGACLPAWGYAVESGSIEVPVRAGWGSQVLVLCEAP
jgi:hypothetical protein